MKTQNRTTRNVIVITDNEDNFLFATDFKNTLDFSICIKHADEFDSKEKANERLLKLEQLGFKGLSVKKYSYDVDSAFLQDAENIMCL